MPIEENRVRFDRGFILEQVAKTPATFDLQARNSKRSVVLGGDNVVTAPVYGPPFITDLERGRRGATIEDFTNFDKMAQAIDQIHCAGGTTVEPEDLPLGTRHLDMVYSHMRWTDKPFMGSVISTENARDTIEMCSILFGGRDKHRSHAGGDQPDQRQQPAALRRPDARRPARILGGGPAGDRHAVPDGGRHVPDGTRRHGRPADRRGAGRASLSSS